MRHLLPVAGLALLFATPSYAQLEECGTYRDGIQAMVSGRDAAGNPVNPELLKLMPERLASPQNNAFCFALFVANQNRLNASIFQQFVKRLEGSRSDKESSAGGGGTGTTAVVAQGPAAKVLSAAVEYGALARAVEGQVVTLRGNLAGLPSALVRKDVFPYCPAEDVEVSEFCVENSALSWLRRVSFSVSFDAARAQVTGTPAAAAPGGTAQPVTFIADRRQLSGWSARLEAWNRRDVTSKPFQTAWRAKVAAAMTQPAADLSKAAGAFVETFLAFPEFADWQKQTVAAVAAARGNREAIITALRTRLEQLVVLAKSKHPDFEARATEALSAYSRFFLAQDDLLAQLATKNVIAVEYTYSQPTGQAATNNYRAIFDLPLTTRTKLVANAALTTYRPRPADFPAVPTYRDAQAGVQLEHGLGSQSIIGPAVITLAGYYQYQHAPSLLKVDPAKPLPGIAFVGLPDGSKAVFTKTGNILLGQFKLALTPAGSSVKIPLSVTVSNKTELVDKPTWRGQVGIAYDFDAILGALR
jgi:hypothetical protein